MENELETSYPLEYNVFALAFRQQGAIKHFSEHLDPEAVGALSGHAGLNQFYMTLLDFYHKTGLDPIDPIAFQAWLEDSEIYAALGGYGGVSVFIDTVLSVDLSTPESVTKTLIQRANKRKQIDYFQELQSLIQDKEFKTEQDRHKIQDLTENIRKIENDMGYDPYENVYSGADIAGRAESLWELPDFVPTQFKELNAAMGYSRETGGFVKGAVHAILAVSGAGKSTLVKSLVNHWVEQGNRILYINYEEAIAHWERVLFSQVTKQNVYYSSELSETEKKHYTKVFRDKMSEWGDRFMVKHDPDTPYFDDLEKWLMDIASHGPDSSPDVVVIDTIQSMFMKGSGGKPRWGEFEEMMVRLERIAKKMHTVLIITAQENNNRIKDRREVVQQSDVGGSVTIVQKSSFTIFITHKKLLSGDDSEDEKIMQLQIPKNRITGDISSLNPPLVRYNDSIKTYEPYEVPADELYEGNIITVDDIGELA